MEQWKEHFALVESSAGSNFFFFFVDTGASLLSLSGKMCVCVCVVHVHVHTLSHSVMSDSFVTLWTVVHQPPLSMEDRQEHWSG